MAGRTQFGKYELVSRLAKGGMGETFKAELVAAAGVKKPVLIKKMLPGLTHDPKLVEAFIQEARVSASLTHANIAQVFDFGEVDGEYFLAMEYVDGRSLEDVLERAKLHHRARLPFQLSAYIVIELLKGLDYAHSRVGPDGVPLNLVHRDISPDNVLLGYEGEVKLVDFGVAKATMAGRTETEPGLVKGKFRYVSPEQAVATPLDARSDVFTVGVVLYELLAGRAPFAGQQYTVMKEIVEGVFVPPRVRAGDVPDVLEEIVVKAMSTDREQRYGSARAMLEPLSRWLYGASPDFSADVLRELMGHLFDGELLSEGRLFASHATARARLAELKPGRDTVVPADPKRAPGVVTQPAQAAVAEGQLGPVPVMPASSAATSAIGEARKTPGWLVGLAAALAVAAVAVVGAEVYQARNEKLEVPAPTPVKPMTAPKPPTPAASPVAATGAEPEQLPPPEPGSLTVFDVEEAPTTFTLTQAHELVVPRYNCFDVAPRTELTLLSAVKTTAMSMSTGQRVTTDFGVRRGATTFHSGYQRSLDVLALFHSGVKAPQLWLMKGNRRSAEAGELCAFALTDHSLEKESAVGALRVAGQAHPLPHATLPVEPDDRLVVHSFPRNKSWVVQVKDLTPPWPVMLVTRNGRSDHEEVVVLDQTETVVKNPESAWLTVPVLAATPYRREVSIRLAAGEKLKETAKDLLAQGKAHFDRKRWGQAAAVFDRCVNAYPDDADCHLMLGASYQRLGYADEAQTQLGEYQRVKPSKPTDLKNILKDLADAQKK